MFYMKKRITTVSSSKFTIAALLFLSVIVNIKANVNFDLSVISQTAAGRTVIGDVDGDGFDDIVVHTWGSNRGLVNDGVLAWYKYPSWNKYTIASGKNYFGDDVVLSDIDNDGDFDVVTCRGNDNSAQVYYYVNPGGSATSGWIERYIGTITTDSEVKDIKIDDFDGDGKLDIAARAQEKLGIYFQNNPTSWTQRIINIRAREGMTIADIDWDGKTDIIMNGFWLKNPLNARTNTWVEYTIDPQWYSDNTGGWQDFSVIVESGDINKDGKPDLVYSHSEKAGYKVTWYTSSNPRGGQSAWVKREIAVVDYCHTLRLGDIDRDGELDIVAANSMRSPSPRLYVIYNNGKGTSWSTSTVDYKSLYKGSIGDIGNDGDLDIVSSTSWEDTPLNIWENTLDPGLAIDAWQRYLIDGSLAYNAMSVLSEDLNGDGLSDIIAGGWWWKNPGTASGTWTKYTIGSPLNSAAIIYDFDKDGDKDIFGTQGTGNVVNKNLAWARNDGNGNFTVITNISTGGSGDFLQGSVISDFGSGDQIALSWHNGGGGLHGVRVPSNPSSTTWSFTTLTSATQQEDLNYGDIDRDGDIDLLLGTMWLRNNGGSWTAFNLGAISDLDPDAVPDRNALVDINGDNRLDAVVSLENGTYLLWFEAPVDPTATWKRHIIGNVEGEGFSMNADDIDNDGDQDIILGEHRGPSVNRVLIFENRNNGLYWNQHIVDSDSKNIIDHHIGTLPVDLDNDGDKDIVSLGWYNKKVWVYENKAIDELYPVIYKQPVSQTVLSGETATFTVSASGAQPLNYQWRKNGVNISGANSSNYTTPPTSNSDNNSIYSCYVYNTHGNAISENAILTVLASSGINIVKNGNFEDGNRNWWAIDNSMGGAGYNFYANSSDPISGNFDMVMAVTSSGSSDSRPMLYANLSENLIIGQAYTIKFKTRVNWGNPIIKYVNYGKGLEQFNGGNALSGNQTWTVTLGSAAQANNFLAFYMDGRSIGAFQIDDVSIYRIASSSPPSINSQPQNITVSEGLTATFSVVASGTSPLNYQWYKNNLLISGATLSSYTTPAVTISDNGAKFTVKITNTEGSVLSNPATLTVNAAAPSIISQPSNQSVIAGQSATFTISVSGSSPLNYQWQKNRVNISGATNSSYTIPTVSLQDNGSQFRCIVSNSAGTITSNEAQLTVIQSGGSNIVRNGNFETGNLDFWSVSNTYGNAVFSFLPNSSNPINGNYDAVLRIITKGTSDNRPLILADLSEPLVVGNSYTLQVKTKVLSGTPRISFINYGDGFIAFNNGEILSGMQTWNFNIESASEANRYLAFYVDGKMGGSFAIDDVSLTPNSSATPPIITSQPASQSVLLGSSVTFSITATGSSPLSYQWKKGGVNITGATSSTYTIPSVSLSDNGAKYSCAVSNSEGIVTSNEAILTVLSSTATNIVRNGNFEDGSKSNWAVSNSYGGAGYNFYVNTDNPINGSYDLAMAVTSSGSSNGRPLLYANLSENFIIGESYVVEFKTRVVSGNPKIAYINFGGGFETFIGGSSLSGTQSWTMTVESATETNNFIAYYLDGRSVGTFQIDEVKVTRGTSTGISPSITQQPISQTVIEGESVTFSITATGSSPLSYQWKRNGVEIPGAGQPSYNINSVLLSDNGAEYSCVISNSQGSVQSSPAVLTVLASSVVNLVENGDFELGNTSSWSVSNTYGNASYSFQVNSNNPIDGQFDGIMRITSAGSSSNRPLLIVKLSEALIVGESYRFAFTTKVISGNPKITYINYGEGLVLFNDSQPLSGTQNWTLELPQATDSNLYIAFYLDGTSLSAFQIDNLTMTPLSYRALQNFNPIAFSSNQNLYNFYLKGSDKELDLQLSQLNTMLKFKKGLDGRDIEKAVEFDGKDIFDMSKFKLRREAEDETIVFVHHPSPDKFEVFNFIINEYKRSDDEFDLPETFAIYSSSRDSITVFDYDDLRVGEINIYAFSENDSLLNVKSDRGKLLFYTSEILDTVKVRIDVYLQKEQNNFYKNSILVKLLPEQSGAKIPTDFSLSQNYPNPFNPETTIEFALPKESRVKIEIYNTLGELVSKLYEGNKHAGVHHVTWNAGGYNSGIYFYRIRAVQNETGNEFMSVKKMVLLK